MARRLLKNHKCEYEGCEELAKYIAAGREARYYNEGGGHPGVGLYCAFHSGVVMEEGMPEYTVGCPNCGCGFGVN
jgi:hypothetical protein